MTNPTSTADDLARPSAALVALLVLSLLVSGAIIALAVAVPGGLSVLGVTAGVLGAVGMIGYALVVATPRPGGRRRTAFAEGLAAMWCGTFVELLVFGVVEHWPGSRAVPIVQVAGLALMVWALLRWLRLPPRAATPTAATDATGDDPATGHPLHQGGVA